MLIVGSKALRYVYGGEDGVNRPGMMAAWVSYALISRVMIFRGGFWTLSKVMFVSFLPIKVPLI